MRQLPGPRGPRAVYYGLLVSAFLVVAGYAVKLTIDLRDTQRREAVERATGELSALIGVWESSVLDKSASWLSDLSENPDPSRREQQIRAGALAVDALYLWSADAAAPTLLYPPPLTAPARSADQERLERELAEAEGLLLSRRPEAAWRRLSRLEPSLYAPLLDPRSEGQLTRTMLRRRLLAADALGDLGDHVRQRNLLERTAVEIVSLPGFALIDALPFLDDPVLSSLEIISEDGWDRLASAVQRARRRAGGLRELQRRLSRLTALVAEESREVAPFSEGGPLQEHGLSAMDLQVDTESAAEGFIWIYGLGARNTRGVAVQLSTEGLLDELLPDLPSAPAQGEITVLDADGRVLRGDEGCAPGTPGDGRAIWARAPFLRVLPGLSLGLCSLPDQPPPHAGTRQTLTQLGPIAVALLLGLAAVLARAGADRRQRELFARQRDFTTRVTHELKTPLAGIRIMAENLEIGAFKDAAQRELLAGKIVSEVDRLGARIDEILRLSRTDHLDARGHLLLHELAAELAAPWQERFATRGATLELDLQPCPAVHADRALLRDALTNLLDNALKYGREDQPLRVRLATRAEGRWVSVEVTDNGLGVPPKQRKAIFEPFVRVEGPDRGKSGGHGLGLAFVAETARVHGGTVECREGVDGGARFILRLRRA